MSKRKRVNDMKYHYTYRITNIKEKMYYYGVHSCDCLPKEDIGVKYWSTSKRDGFIDHQKQNPEQYKYNVIKIFETRIEAVIHEMFLHSKFNVKLHKKFYNDANQTSTGFDTTGKGNYVDENGKTILISREEAVLLGLTSQSTGMVTAKDIFTGNNIKITQEEFNLNNNYVGITKGNKYIRSREYIEQCKGYNNSQALKINILDADNNIMYECFGDFREICKQNKLPYKQLYKSYNTDYSVYSSNRKSAITQVINLYGLEHYNKYKMWKAVSI